MFHPSTLKALLAAVGASFKSNATDSSVVLHQFDPLDHHNMDGQYTK
jgi:hypothetical protein